MVVRTSSALPNQFVGCHVGFSSFLLLILLLLQQDPALPPPEHAVFLSLHYTFCISVRQLLEGVLDVQDVHPLPQVLA